MNLKLALLTTVGLLLSACGNVTTSGNTNTTPTLIQGTLSALNLQGNSITVAGETLSLNSASVTRNGLPVSSSALSVGQHVEVDRSNTSAPKVNIRTEVRGTVSAVDTAAGTIMVAGQVIKVDSTTQIHLSSDRDDRAGTGTLANITVGLYVEVSLRDATVTPPLASSVEIKDAREQAEDDHDSTTNSSELRGTVSGLNAAAKTFMIGNVTVNYSAATVEGTLTDGASIEVKGTYNATTGILNATKLEVKYTSGTRREDTELYGQVAGLDSAAKTFMLGSVTVNYASATVQGTLSAGAKVEVKGYFDPTTRVLTATKVEVKGTVTSTPGSTVKLEGRLSLLDTTAKQFTLGTYRVDYATATVSGTLMAGQEVKVRGTLTTTTPNMIVATSVEVDH